MEKMEFTKLIYPEMREEMIEYLDVIDSSKSSISENDFESMIHFFFDDTSLSRDPDKNIGYFLRDKNESKLISELTLLIDDIFIKYGSEFSAAHYVNLPEWDIVVSKSRKLKKLLFES